MPGVKREVSNYRGARRSMKQMCWIFTAMALDVTFAQNTAAQNDISLHEERFVQSNGVKLHYLDWGGSGEPLVLLTGYGAEAHVFDSLAARFSKRFHVIAFTRRGRAPSERTPTGYDLKTLTSDLQGALDALKLQKVHLAGHSFGGAEMTQFATLHPQRVISLVYFDAALDAAAAEAVMKDAPFPTPKYPPATPYAQVLEWWTSYTPDFSKLRSPALAFYAVQDRNPHIPPNANEDSRQRANEFWQTRWTPMIRRTAEKFGREAPNSRVVILKDAPHYLFQEKEEEVVQEMLKFYASITARN
jgi:pimeloyl-ACP methyl ester carboxylesterase